MTIDRMYSNKMYPNNVLSVMATCQHCRKLKLRMSKIITCDSWKIYPETIYIGSSQKEILSNKIELSKSERQFKKNLLILSIKKREESKKENKLHNLLRLKYVKKGISFHQLHWHLLPFNKFLMKLNLCNTNVFGIFIH